MNRDYFKIGSFNLINLVLPNFPYHHSPGFSPDEYQRKLSWTGSQLDIMGADIVGFQEIFHRKAFQDALSHSTLFNQAGWVAAPPESGEGPFVGLASRFKVAEFTVIENFPCPAQVDIEGVQLPLNRFSRPVLKARIHIRDDLSVTIFCVHLKSKRPLIPTGADPEDPVEQAKGQVRSLITRGLEATALRALLVEALQDTDHPVIVIGDCNDSDFSVSSRIIAGDPPWRKLQQECKRGIWDQVLYHVKNIQARQCYSNVYYTYIFNGQYESLDHILVSQHFVEMNPGNIGRVVYTSVFNDHLIDETLGHEITPRWQSDHGQVVASFEVVERT